jgi:hypothetical protein
MNVEQPENAERLQYADRLIVLNNNALLIARILVDQKYKMENAIAVYRPLQIFADDEDIFMRKWVPTSSDDVYVIPMGQIMTMATPNEFVNKTFQNIIMNSYSNDDPVIDPIGDTPVEEVEQEVEQPAPKSNKRTLH